MPGNPFTDPNWASDLADTVERVVGGVRDKTTTPILKATRYIVFGALAAILGIVVVVLLLIIATRGLQALLDLGLPHERSVYVSYLIVGGILGLAGLFVLRKRNSAQS
ncbi:hypothetical protein [Desertimonas flava]|jgi:hypothetical protein|uniref:hypothetical protein n=1 Tax=Desertimonas flava TaxID=2064846 RepID=UPI000E350271|nr:hypothetical protein [Desertimonas flava]